MAQVFQCDACKEIGTKGGSVALLDFEDETGPTHELCIECFGRVSAILSPPARKPRGPKPGSAAAAGDA